MHNAFMSEPHDRLRRARLEAGYRSGTDAAKAMGAVEATYLGHENGSRGLGRAATRYASFYGVSVEWLLTGRGTPKPNQKHPVIELWETIPTHRHQEVLDFMEFVRSRKRD